jgi:nucleotide-binding universal stress UspA family protein
MIRQLLVGVDQCKHSESATRYACSLARLQKARVLGVAVVDTEGIDASYHTSRPLGAGSADAELYQKRLEEARAGADASIKKFREICEEQKVEYKAEIREGGPEAELLQAAKLSDVLVLGKMTQMEFDVDKNESCGTWWEVLSKSERPLILVPEIHHEINRVMIAVDFHRLTDRLLFNYVHLNPYPGAEVHLIHAADPDEKDKEIPPELVEYMETHGVNVTPKTLYGEHKGQAIVNYADTENIDLAVIGLHTMSKVVAALLGSTARFVIQNLEIPVYAQT